jgi:hypothetical protein
MWNSHLWSVGERRKTKEAKEKLSYEGKEGSSVEQEPLRRKVPKQLGASQSLRVPVTPKGPLPFSPLLQWFPSPAPVSREIPEAAESGGHPARPVSPAHANNCS